jgi:hypothetical protein
VALSILFVGGSGQISLASVREAVAAGHKVTVFNRGKSSMDVGIKPTVKLVIPHITVVIGWDRIHAVDELGLLFSNREILEDSGPHTGQNGRSYHNSFLGGLSVDQKRDGGRLRSGEEERNSWSLAHRAVQATDY